MRNENRKEDYRKKGEGKEREGKTSRKACTGGRIGRKFNAEKWEGRPEAGRGEEEDEREDEEGEEAGGVRGNKGEQRGLVWGG